ncbi:arylesterase [Legionella worsleiensis]|uniref:Esterase TesA n=1 Tax=Legionella worsleiensis TaxID=45076 RepID=A0A0W1AA95_9GAMM|nr:arylesterase [Legionella worsleiensis]KTD78235.1 Esterase TesA precursor [Legionella worsleiensis]STY32572.1 Esterase TesA precursor [Legionella worsleiensis]
MKRMIFLLLCLLPFFLVLLLPAKSEPTLLIIGDSLSYAYGIRSQDSWVSLLQERLKKNNYHYQVVNYSIPGDVTENGLKRLQWALDEYKPKITVIEMGANDGLQHVPIKTIQANLLKMIILAKQHKSKVLLLGMRLPVEYPSSYRAAFANLYPVLANQQNIALVPVFLKHVDSNAYLMQDDKLHPKKEGQAILLETVWSQLKKLL